MSQDEIRIGPYHGTLAARGGFASVYRVTDADGQCRALKIADAEADEVTRTSILHEYRVQSELIYPRIPRAHTYGVLDGRPYVVLDWIDGPPLWNHVPSETGKETFGLILRAIADVLSFIHHRGWVHGDLKPENFRWKLAQTTESQAPALCLLDFGLARPIGDADRPRGAGTVGYCAPEFLNRLPADGRADWYSVGAILYEHVFGRRPYASDDPAEEIAGHLEGAPDLARPRVNTCSDEQVALIGRLLSKTADERGADLPALVNSLGLGESLHQELLLSHLPAHHASQNQRLGPGEAEIAASIVTNPHDWSVHAFGRDLSPLQRMISTELLQAGCAVAAERDESNAVFVTVDDGSSRCEKTRIRLTPHLSVHGSEPVAQGGAISAICLLPWGRREIGEYLAGIIGDPEIAEQCAPTILACTGGLPAAVSQLVGHLIETHRLSLGDEGWEFDADAALAWRGANLLAAIENQLGPLVSAESSVCMWLAVGEGHGCLAVLCDLMGESQETLARTCRTLVDRGYLVWTEQEGENRLALRLRVPGHNAALRYAMAPELLTGQSLALAESLERREPEPRPLRRLMLAHAFERSTKFDKAADYSLRTAALAISADDRQKAFAYIARAQSCAEKISDPTLRSHWQGQAHMVEGDLQKALGQLDVAHKIYRELLAICRLNGDQRLLAETLYDLGELYRIMRRYDKGIRAELRARRLWEVLGDRKELSRTLNALGNLHWVAADLTTAREYYLQALTIQKELRLDPLVATNLNNLGAIHIARFEYEQAETYLVEALGIQERIGVPVEQARNLNNLGGVKFLRGRLDEATDFFARAAALNGEAGAQSEELFNRRNLVEVAVEQGDLRTAVTLGQQVYRECRDLGDVSTGAEVSALLADTYQRAGDFRHAARFHTETRTAAAELKNDELQTYLSIQEASRAFRFGSPERALELLDQIAPADQRLANRYQYLDTLILRLQIASAAGQEGVVARLWEAGRSDAAAIAAPHKAVQLAWAWLSGARRSTSTAEIETMVEVFLQTWPRWHWASAFHIWQAQQSLVARSYEVAQDRIGVAIAQLRRDGNGETLWRALVVQGETCHMQADYEPAMRALDEADRMLKAVAATVEDENDRARYLAQPLAETLERVRSRILELVA
jgi:serine/threonine protein kinase/tetratricopeptide (TPR) repeat protein